MVGFLDLPLMYHLTTVYQAIVQFECFNLILSCRWKGWKKHIFYLLFILPIYYILAFNAFFSYTFIVILNLGSMVFYVMVSYKDTIMKKALCCFCLIALNSMTDMLTMEVAWFSQNGVDQLQILNDFPFSDLALKYRIYTSLLVTFIDPVFVLIWQRTIQNKDFSHCWYFGCFPISQFLIFSFLHPASYETLADVANTIPALLLTLLADFIMFFIVLQQIKKEELNRSLRQKQYHQQFEQQYFQSLEQNFSQLEKTCHDCNNQLLTIYNLIENNQAEKANAVLQEAKSYLNNILEGSCHAVDYNSTDNIN